MTKEPAPTAEEQPDDQCSRCRATMDLPYPLESTEVCNLCAQVERLELKAQLAAALCSNREKDAQLAKTEMAWKEQNAAANAMMRRAELAEKLLAEKDAKIAELEKSVEKWEYRARGFADTIVAINTKVFGRDNPYDDEAKEWPDGLLSDEVLALKNRADVAEAKLRALPNPSHR